VSVLFVLPRAVEQPSAEHVQLATPASPGVAAALAAEDAAGVPGSSFTLESFEHAEFHAVEAEIRPYQTPPPLENQPAESTTSRTTTVVTHDEPPGDAPTHAQPSESVQSQAERVKATDSTSAGAHYGGDLFAEVQRYARLACKIAANEEFDVIHAHDWMTYQAGIAVKQLTGKPLVVHVHSTEFDRSGENVNQQVYDIERAGIHAADRVITVSYLTRGIVLARYGGDPKRVRVVYNAIDDNGAGESTALPDIGTDEKIVLFLGRITMQKGPEYFLGAAKRVLEVYQNVRFIMAGSGDLVRPSIEMAAEMGIGHKVLFTGFLRGDDVRRVFRMADLYVMPSVSEPFGIAPLEALSNDVPVLISKQSGVAEILTHALKVDFWDVDEMANKIVAVLRHPPLQSTLRDHGRMEVRRMSWTDSAADCVRVYEEAIEDHKQRT
jgi:glycosyltransferase involved in cell wall biosynthesis